MFLRCQVCELTNFKFLINVGLHRLIWAILIWFAYLDSLRELQYTQYSAYSKIWFWKKNSMFDMNFIYLQILPANVCLIFINEYPAKIIIVYVNNFVSECPSQFEFFDIYYRLASSFQLQKEFSLQISDLSETAFCNWSRPRGKCKILKKNVKYLYKELKCCSISEFLWENI